MKKETPFQYRWRRLRGNQLILLSLHLVLPTLALFKLNDQLEIPWQALPVTFTSFSLLSFLIMWRDKSLAKNQTRRIPELSLHLLEAIGGWPGSRLAQIILRHKNKKKRYQVIFWLIVNLYQLLTLEYLRDWALAKKLLSMI